MTSSNESIMKMALGISVADLYLAICILAAYVCSYTETASLKTENEVKRTTDFRTYGENAVSMENKGDTKPQNGDLLETGLKNENMGSSESNAPYFQDGNLVMPEMTMMRVCENYLMQKENVENDEVYGGYNADENCEEEAEEEYGHIPYRPQRPPIYGYQPYQDVLPTHNVQTGYNDPSGYGVLSVNHRPYGIPPSKFGKPYNGINTYPENLNNFPGHQVAKPVGANLGNEIYNGYGISDNNYPLPNGGNTGQFDEPTVGLNYGNTYYADQYGPKPDRISTSGIHHLTGGKGSGSLYGGYNSFRSIGNGGSIPTDNLNVEPSRGHVDESSYNNKPIDSDHDSIPHNVGYLSEMPQRKNKSDGNEDVAGNHGYSNEETNYVISHGFGNLAPSSMSSNNDGKYQNSHGGDNGTSNDDENTNAADEDVTKDFGNPKRKDIQGDRALKFYYDHYNMGHQPGKKRKCKKNSIPKLPDLPPGSADKYGVQHSFAKRCRLLLSAK